MYAHDPGSSIEEHGNALQQALTFTTKESPASFQDTTSGGDVLNILCTFCRNNGAASVDAAVALAESSIIARWHKFEACFADATASAAPTWTEFGDEFGQAESGAVL